MTTKVRIKVGEVEVDFEGPESFLTKKLPDLISQLSSLAKQVPSGSAGSSAIGSGGGGTGGGNTGTLPAFLKEKRVGKNQKKKFLATAQWLHLKGSERIRTGDVAKALRDSHQGRITDPSICLAKNVTHGNCEKVGEDFFVTDDGRRALA